MNAQDFPTTELPWRAELLIWFGLIWQDWLYGDGEDATKSIYFDALDLTKRFSREPFISFSLGEKAKRTSLGPYRRPVPRVLGVPRGVGVLAAE